MYSTSEDINDYDIDDESIQTSRMLSDHTAAQNGGWMKPTDEELEAFKEGKMKLYCEHIRFKFHLIADSE